MPFYNSNKERGATLAKSRKKAAKQDDKVFDFFKRHKSHDFTPYQIWLYYQYVWPLTSIRRSIHTLWTDGKLIDTGLLRKGGYGKPNRVYKYNPKAK